MKTNTKIILLLTCIGFLNVLVIGQQYFQLPKKVIPAEHTWVFDKDNLSRILIQHLRSLGTNVPHGGVDIQGMEIHYSPYSVKQQIALTVKEYRHEKQTTNQTTEKKLD
jgi:hypothetical protein